MLSAAMKSLGLALLALLLCPSPGESGAHWEGSHMSGTTTHISAPAIGALPHLKASSVFPAGFWYCVEVPRSQRSSGLPIKSGGPFLSWKPPIFEGTVWRSKRMGEAGCADTATGSAWRPFGQVLWEWNSSMGMGLP